MRLPQLFLALAVLASAAPAVQSAPKTPFMAELDRQCPARQLQDRSAGDLELIMGSFVERLTPAQRHKVEDAIGYRCARIEAGLTCGNNASLDTFRRLDLLRSFVREGCAAGWTCRGFADCVQAKP